MRLHQVSRKLCGAITCCQGDIQCHHDLLSQTLQWSYVCLYQPSNLVQNASISVMFLPALVCRKGSCYVMKI